MKIKIFAFIGLALLLILLALPTAVSKLLSKSGFNYHEFYIHVEHVSLSWLGPQKIERVRGKSAELALNLDVDSILIENGLLSMLTHFSLGQVTVEKPILYIQPRQEGALQETFVDSVEEEVVENNNHPLTVPSNHLLIKDGSVRVVNQDGSVTRIDQTQLDLQNTHNEISLLLNGLSAEGEKKGTFHIESSFDQKSPRNISFIPLLPLHLKAQVIDFPTKVIDEVARIFGLPPLFLQQLIGPEFNLNLEHEKTKYDLEFTSAHLNGNGLLEQQGEVFKAIVPLSFKWELSPETLNPLLKQSSTSFLLDQKTELFFSLLDLIGNPLEFKSSFQLQIAPTTLIFPANDAKLRLESFSIDSKVDLPKDQRAIAGIGQFNFNGTPFNFNIESTTQLEILNPVCLEDCLKGQWNILIDKIPTPLLEVLFHSKTSLEKAFGPYFSFAFSITQKGNETLIGTKITNQALTSPWIQFSWTPHNVILKKPVQLDFKPSQELQFTLDGQPYALDFTQPLILKINQATFTRDLKNASFNAELLGEHVSFKDHPFQFNQFQFGINKLKNGGIDTLLKTKIAFNDPSLIGPTLNLTSQAHIELKEHAFEVKPFVLEAESNLLKIAAHLKMDPNYRITPLSSIQAHYILDSTVSSNIVQPATFDLNIFASNTFIDLIHPKNSQFKALLKSTPLLIQENDNTLIQLENLEASFSGDFSKDEIQLRLYATSGKTGLVDANLEVSDLFFNDKLSLLESCYRGKISFEKFPSLLMRPLLKDHHLAFLLGQEFNATMEGILFCNQDPNGLIELHFESDHLDIATHFKMDQKSIRIFSNPSEENLISLHFSQEAAKKLAPQFNSPLNGQIVLEYIKIPNLFYHPHSLLDLIDEVEGIGSIQVQPFSLDDFEISSLSGKFELPPDQPIHLDLSQKNHSDFLFRLFLDRPIAPIEHWSDLEVQASFQGQNIPLTYLAKQLQLEPIIIQQIDALFSNQAKIAAELELKDSKGPIKIEVQGKNCQLEGFFKLDNSFLLLEQPLLLNMHVTPQIGKTILGDIVPLLSSVIAANGTIQLEIDPDGFMIPIKDFKGVMLNRGVIQVGVLTLNVDEEIADILNFLKFTAGREVQVWSTPIYFSVKSQAIKLDRFDFLVANRFPLALWGKIDFLKDNASLKVGLSAATLDQVFDIKHLPDDFILPITLRGPLNDISLDKSKATARIATLIAESKGSTEGMLLGNLLGLFSGSFNEEPPPPPTTTPFPWAKNHSPSGNPSPTPEKAAEQKTDKSKLLKNLAEGAKSFLKNIEK